MPPRCKGEGKGTSTKLNMAIGRGRCGCVVGGGWGSKAGGGRYHLPIHLTSLALNTVPSYLLTERRFQLN